MECKKCKKNKQENEFYKGSRTCKKCRIGIAKEWKKNNPEKVKSSQRKIRKERNEELLEYERKYRAANRDKVNAAATKYREANRDKTRARCLKHYHENKWKYKEYREAHREEDKIYSKNYKKRNLEKVRKRHAELGRGYRQKNPLKFKARKLVYYAVKRGKLIRPKICCMCGNTGHIEAHHYDYNKPLEVTWVCRPCHSGITMMLRTKITRS